MVQLSLSRRQCYISCLFQRSLIDYDEALHILPDIKSAELYNMLFQAKGWLIVENWSQLLEETPAS
jgi:hypothetical protein